MNTEMSNLLDILKQNLSQNRHGSSGNRYNDLVMKISAYLLIRGGNSMYEFLRVNLALPSTKWVYNNMMRFQHKLEEGRFYFDELKLFLESRNYPMEVAILEDGTKVTEAVEYDAQSKSLVGLVPRIDPSSGLPFLRCFPALTAQEIEYAVKNYSRSSYLQIIIAKPNRTGKLQFFSKTEIFMSNKLF